MKNITKENFKEVEKQQNIWSISLSLVGIMLIIGFGILAVNNSKNKIIDMAEPIETIVLIIAISLITIIFVIIYTIISFDFNENG